MSYLALYRKYRPKRLEEVVGQSEIKKILASSVKNGTISHAYLFSGPRGTGKTTMAKILAKMVNCEHPVDGNACDECDSCTNILNSSDVIEIDAASNNGVDEIRDLREKANLVPSSARYKVYIIDEVHMLTTQAFNALLKTLEEPPRHVIFVLATTEYYKIPMTITSRCQKFQFNKLSIDELVSKLSEISECEKIKISNDALFEIAKLSDGGMRDSINFLDQLRSFTDEEITLDDVYNVCGDVSSAKLVELFGSIQKCDYENVMLFFEKLDSTGKNYNKFLENMVSFLKDAILLSKNVNRRYIKSNVDDLKKINSLYSEDMLFYIIDSINKLMDKLKFASRQSTMVVTNFMLIMNKFDDKKEKQTIENTEKNNDEYDMAFTLSNDSESVKLQNNEENNTDDVNDNSKFLQENDMAELKEIIINNTFALANKNLKKEIQEKLKMMTEYLTDKKYKVAAGTLVDVKLEAAGDGYLIFSSVNDAVVDRIYANSKIYGDFINHLLEDKYNYVVLTTDEWNKCRDEYVNNFKNGKKYVLKPLEDAQKKIEKVKKEPTVIDKLFDLVGEENVEIK